MNRRNLICRIRDFTRMVARVPNTSLCTHIHETEGQNESLAEGVYRTTPTPDVLEGRST